MRNRIHQLKAKNIREDGPDAIGLKDYRKAVQPLTTMGAERVIAPEHMKRLERARGDVKAAHELKYIEEVEGKIAALAEIKKARPLTEVEEKTWDHLQKLHARAREMLNVPDDALQVDVFTHDPATGKLSKTHFYTKAEAPEHLAQLHDEKKAAMATAGGSMHPIVQSQASALGAAAQIAADRPLAPYALAELRRQTSAPRDDEDDADGNPDTTGTIMGLGLPGSKKD